MPRHSPPLKPWGVYQRRECSLRGFVASWQLVSHHDTREMAKLHGTGEHLQVCATKAAGRGWWERASS